jgi:hypothetical protein
MNETPMKYPKECEEKGRLLEQYHVAVSEWSQVTEQLEAQPHAFIQRAKQLRDVAIKAKAAYIEHKLEHGC